ncbi:MAG: hypothetical protein IIC02_06695 [Planctomycetes bacterium]|nr:hypothetical protein [Planctomycetota bacterium]
MPVLGDHQWVDDESIPVRSRAWGGETRFRSAQFEGPCGCGEPVFDSDGDSVPDGLDVCPLQDDTIDEDLDGAADCLSTIPATSTWGVIVLALLLMTAAKVDFRFRAKQVGYRDSAKSS